MVNIFAKTTLGVSSFQCAAGEQSPYFYKFNKPMNRFQGIDSPANVASLAWRAGTSNRVVVPTRQAGNRFLGSLKGLQIRALERCPFSINSGGGGGGGGDKMIQNKKAQIVKTYK